MPRKKFKPFKARKAKQSMMQVDCLDGLPAPNHNNHPSLYDLEDDLLCNLDTAGAPTFPLLKLSMSETPGMAAPGTLAFIDKRYGVKDWADYMVCLDICKNCAQTGRLAFLQRPPSWMDPEVFVRMLDKHPRTRAVRMYLKQGHTGRRIKMNQHIQQVFEDEYLVYMLEQFSEVRDLLAQWVIAHYAEGERNARSAGRNQLAALKPTQRAELLRYTQRLVPPEGPASTRAGELLRHALTLCTTPVWQLQQHSHCLWVLEPKYVLLAASDLWPVAEELHVPSWATLVLDVMIYSNRDAEIAQLLGVVLSFIEHHTVVDDVRQAQ